MLVYLLAAVVLQQGVQGLSREDIPQKPLDGDLWVVLAAGSNGWFNYRHQADVCHAYQIVSSHGIPDDHIIVLMYDDLANNEENPTPGVIINHPNGTDVYHGVPKDYTGKDVNPEVFLKVLRGMKTNTGSGKTLDSTEKDHVFVYFSDHGAKGLVAFGESILKAKDLMETIGYMHSNNKYAKLVFYLEACESGSMFQGLLDPSMNVFATTASNSTTSSYACYWDMERKTFLGDVYSIKWLEDSDKEDIETETLEAQYATVKKETNTSMVCQFGDMSISKLPVGNFQGEKPTDSYMPEVPPDWLTCGATAVPGPEVPIQIQQRIIQESQDPQEQQEARDKLDSLLKHRMIADATIHSIVNAVAQNDMDLIHAAFNNNVVLTEFECYYAAVDAFHESCFNLGQNDYALRLLNPFVNLCHAGMSADVIVEAIMMNCDHTPYTGIY